MAESGMTAKMLQRDLEACRHPDKAAIFARFFKTGPGEYGFGDQFLGLTVPQTRQVAKKYIDLPIKELDILIKNPWHEVRLCALVICTLHAKSKKTSMTKRLELFDFYMRNLQWINNWDLIDISAESILGPLCPHFSYQFVDELAKSDDLWHRRIAMLTTFYDIRQGRFDWTLKLAKLYLDDPRDLLQKVTGWLLREIGKRDQPVLEGFLQTHLAIMPRTMLRYAIEKFPEQKRQRYLKGTIIKKVQ